MAKAQRLSPQQLADLRRRVLAEGTTLFEKACPVPSCHSVVVAGGRGVACLTCGWTRVVSQWGEKSANISARQAQEAQGCVFRGLTRWVDPTRWHRLLRRAEERGEKALAARLKEVLAEVGSGSEHHEATVPARSSVQAPVLLVEKHTPHLPDSPRVVIFTDGACEPNPGPGGWAAVLIAPGVELELAGRARATTNNRMELTAALMGLRALRAPSRATVVTDSRYVYYGMTDWITGWSRAGWRRTGRSIPNSDLWRLLAEEALKHHTLWSWTRGHAGQKENERCDRLAASMINPLAEDREEICYRKRRKRRKPVPQVPEKATAPIWLPQGPEEPRP